MIRLRSLIAVMAAFALLACSDDNSDSTEDIPRVLGPNEKADDFRSESAQEYFVRGTTEITLGSEMESATEDEKLQEVRELIPYKQVVLGFFLNTYLIDKSSHNDNEDYGGFKALTKNGSYEDLDIRHVDGLTYEFDFVQEIGGDLDLLAELGRRANATANEDGSWTFEYAVGELTNEEMTDLEHGGEWYRGAPWSSFSTESVDESKWYMQEVELVEQERSHDAWIDFHRLLADGTLNADVFFGWDYHDAYHQKHAKATYEWLLDQGFEAPVESWEDYASNRAPLTKTVRAGDDQVDVEITLWWGEPGTETDPDTDAGGDVLEEAMRESLQNNEVTAYSGHSGPWYGFALANWRKTSAGDLDDSEIPELDMPADKYQIVLAEGCDTYALGEAFWKNPAKADRQSLDIITTTSFSNAGSADTVTDMLGALVKTDDDDHLDPVRYSTLLSDLDSNSFWFQTMYGVHGIDDNPHGHPFGSEESICGECQSDADCGGVGNGCVELDGANVCTYECTADDGCPDGFTCRETVLSGLVSTDVCVPSSFTCDDIPDGLQQPLGVYISEVLADPPSGSAGDVNGDGIRDARQDEFVELHNAGDEEVDLSGFSISDNVSVRHVLGGGISLAPGERLVIFGGGDPANFTGLPDVTVLVADGLFLNNSGDALELADFEGELIDSVRYHDARGTSLVRESRLDEVLSASEGEPTPGE